jgi:hypothetical protein
MAVPTFLLPLLSQGLGLLANGVLAKGKSWVKDKTGIDLESASLNSDDFIKLKQLELEHEIELLELQQKQNMLQVEIERAYLADIQSARSTQAIALQQSDLFSKRFVYYFASVWSIFAMVYLLWITFGEVPEDNVRFADTVLGFLLGTVIAGIFTFLYGSSRSSQNKDSVIQEVITNVTGK